MATRKLTITVEGESVGVGSALERLLQLLSGDAPAAPTKSETRTADDPEGRQGADRS